MALSLGFLTPKDLLGKVERDLAKLDSAIVEQNEGHIGDALYNFSVSVTSVKDWLKSHASSSYMPADVEAVVARSTALSSFRDIANARKHRFVNQYKPTTDDVTLSAMPSYQIVSFDDENGQPKRFFRVKIIRANGERLEAGSLAQAALDAWRAFMARHGV